jgi:hypothetical protein
MLHTLQSQNLVGVKEVLVKELGFIFEIIWFKIKYIERK